MRKPTLALAVLAGSIVAANAEAQVTTRVSISVTGGETSFDSRTPAASGNGEVVAFQGDQILVRDRAAGLTEQVAAGDFPSVSADGRYVAFQSRRSNLVPNDTNGAEDVFILDRVTSAVTRTSVGSGGIQANDRSFTPSISANGRFVAFISRASNLVSGDSNGVADVFVHDTQTGVTFSATVDPNWIIANGESAFPGVTDDGELVVFSSKASNLVAGDTNGQEDVFLFDHGLGRAELVSRSSGGVQGNGRSSYPSITRSGAFISFRSNASNLAPIAANGIQQVYLRDLHTGSTEVVSLGQAGSPGNNSSGTGNLGFNPQAVSDDARYVAFYSDATDLVPGDTNGVADIFLRDRALATTTRVSVSTQGAQANDYVVDFAIARDGLSVVFATEADNLVPNDNNDAQDIFHHQTSGCGSDPQAYCTAKVNSQGCTPAVSWQGYPTLSGADDFVVTASDVLNRKSGIFFWGYAPFAAHFQGGWRCVKYPVKRTPIQDSGGSAFPANDCSGTYSFHFSQAYMAARGLTAGTRIYGQFWSRDPFLAPPKNTGLTDAVQFTVCP